MANSRGSGNVKPSDESERYRSISELVALKLPGFPKTSPSWYALVEREKWPYREVPAQGGRYGVRREYLVPGWVEDTIQGINFGREVALPAAKAMLGSTTDAGSELLAGAFDESVMQTMTRRRLKSGEPGVKAGQPSAGGSNLRNVNPVLLSMMAELFAHECRQVGIDVMPKQDGVTGAFVLFLINAYAAIEELPAGVERQRAIVASLVAAAEHWRDQLALEKELVARSSSASSRGQRKKRAK